MRRGPLQQRHGDRPYAFESRNVSLETALLLSVIIKMHRGLYTRSDLSQKSDHAHENV